MSDYEEYLKSGWWRWIRNHVLERDRHRCVLCNSGSDLHIHHRSYEQKGEEHLHDLYTLCGDCHKKHHGSEEMGESIETLNATVETVPMVSIERRRIREWRRQKKVSIEKARQSGDEAEMIRLLAEYQEQTMTEKAENRFCGTCGKNDKTVPADCVDYGTCSKDGVRVYSWNPACDVWEPIGDTK